MFFIPIAAGVVGALLMGRTKPKTPHEKKLVLGTKSGLTWQVEDFEAAGFIVVRGADGSRGVFMRAAVKTPGAPGFVWQHGQGVESTLRAMILDIAPQTFAKPPAPPAPAPAPPAERPRTAAASSTPTNGKGAHP